jgi:hypothetical protein
MQFNSDGMKWSFTTAHSALCRRLIAKLLVSSTSTKYLNTSKPCDTVNVSELFLTKLFLIFKGLQIFVIPSTYLDLRLFVIFYDITGFHRGGFLQIISI